MGIQDLHDEYPAAYLSYGTRLFQSRERFQKSAGNIKNLQGIAFLKQTDNSICHLQHETVQRKRNSGHAECPKIPCWHRAYKPAKT